MRALIFCIICLFTFESKAQDCGTLPFSKEQTKQIETLVTNYRGVSSSGLTYLPVKLHLTKTVGTNYYSTNSFMFEFAKLNEKFLPMGFQFYLCDSVNYIDNYILDDLDGQYNTADSLKLVEENVNDAINLYYVNDSNVGGRSNFISGDKFYNWMFVKNGVWNSGETLIHEMGHYFNLYHTFTTTFGNELVNGTNCSVAGDLVCDTPADRVVSSPSYNGATCTYTGTETDGNGQPYSPSMDNYMSYYAGGCILNFTTGQAARAQSSHMARLNLITAAGDQYGFNYPSNDTIQIVNSRAFDLYGSVRIRWFSYSSPIGFVIERSTNPTSGFVTIGGVAGFLREFVDSDVVNGTTYYYRVKSANSIDNYGNTAMFTSNQNSYSVPTSYYPDRHDVRYIQLYDAFNVSKLYAFFPRNSEPFLDYSNKVYSIQAGEKFSLYWLDYDNTSTSRDSFKVWIDLNNNQLFENNEILVNGYNNNGRSVDSLLIQNATPSGYYRLRFRTSSISHAFTADDRQWYSDTKDITVYIQGACAQDLPVSGYVFYNIISNGLIQTVDYTQNYYDPYFPEYTYPVNLKSPSIILNPGFSADGGSPFLAEAGGCP